jgi:hypothetical protein
VHCRTGCHVLAAELLDRPGMVGWAKAFIHAAHMQPGLWGLHNYSDANRKTTFNTRQLLRGVRGRIWLTETGGIVYRNNHSKYYFPQSAAHAARATTWLFTKVIPMSRRIERVYLYEWNATRSRAKWDTALIDAHGHARPAFKVLAKILAKMKPKPKVVVKPLPAPAPPPPTSTTPASPPPGG